MEWFKFYHNKWLSDPAIRSLSATDRLIFITLLCLASQTDDRDGVVRYVSNEALRSVTLGGNAGTTEGDSGGVEALEKVGLVELLEGDKLRILNFEKRQNMAMTNAERQKLYRERNKTVTRRNERYNDSNAREDKIREDKNTYIRSFEEFWKVYPRKVSKTTAEKSWNKLKPSPSLVEKILADVTHRANSESWIKDGRRFCPHPSTYINQKRWEDEEVVDEVLVVD